MRICVGCPRMEFYTSRWNSYLEAISDHWPGARLNVPLNTRFGWKYQPDLTRDVKKSDIFIMLEIGEYIDRIQYRQYRIARSNKMPVFVFRNGTFLKVVRAKAINFSDDRRRYARLIVTSDRGMQD